MTKITLVPGAPDNMHLLNCCDSSFTADACASVSAVDGVIQLSFKLIQPYEYHFPYPPNLANYADLDDPHRAIFLALVGGELAGQILLKENWNRWGYVDDLAVDRRFRRVGVGTLLMNQAVNWARSRSLPGLMLETSTHNAGACAFYQRFGFIPAGFDRLLYSATLPGSAEIALYWYYRFEKKN
jgi:streptothricin acetyltransferase